MGRNYSGKNVRDTETAAESTIFNTLFSNIDKKSSDITAQMTVTAQMQSDHQYDDFLEKKKSQPH